MNPLITVYIASYNYAKYVETAIKSVLTQTCQDFELIIIDDGSTDESREIIKKYENHEKIKVIFQQNKGLNATNNVAIKHSKGRYIIRLDADDFFEPEALGVMLSILEGDRNLGLIFPDYYYVDIDDSRIGTLRRHFFDDEVTLYDQPAHGACTMIRLDYLKKLGGYDETFSCQDGFELWIKFITFYKVTNISRPLFSYRKHESSLSTNQDKILETRRYIKRKFAEKHLKSLDTLGIIPIRNRRFEGHNWSLFEYKGKKVIDHLIDNCQATQNLNHLVITTSNQTVLKYLKDSYSANDFLSIIKRPAKLEAYDIKLNKTIDFILNQKDWTHETLALVSVEYPFIDSNLIDEALDTLNIFNSESLISVKPSKGPFYRHNGKTLKAILDQDKHTSYEREALYQSVGGLMVSTVEGFNKNNSLIGERVSHLLVNDKSSFGVIRNFQFQLFKLMVNNHIL